MKSNKKNIEFQEIENLLKALGADLHEGNGSRVRYTLNDIPISLHRPHPEKEAKHYQIKQLREFLEGLGYKHDEI